MHLNFDSPKDFYLSLVDIVLGSVPVIGYATSASIMPSLFDEDGIHKIGTIAVTIYFLYRLYAYVRDDMRKNKKVNEQEERDKSLESTDKE